MDISTEGWTSEGLMDSTAGLCEIVIVDDFAPGIMQRQNRTEAKITRYFALVILIHR
jgi:hypothetical protein